VVKSKSKKYFFRGCCSPEGEKFFKNKVFQNQFDHLSKHSDIEKKEFKDLELLSTILYNGGISHKDFSQTR
jgi:hypothetical protein